MPNKQNWAQNDDKNLGFVTISRHERDHDDYTNTSVLSDWPMVSSYQAKKKRADSYSLLGLDTYLEVNHVNSESGSEFLAESGAQNVSSNGEFCAMDRFETKVTMCFKLDSFTNLESPTGNMMPYLLEKQKKYYSSQNSVNTVKSRTVWGKVNTFNDMDSRETCKHTSVCDTKKCVINVACQSIKGGVNTATDNDFSNVSKIQRLTVR